MIERILLWLCDYSYRIITYLFWLYFLLVIALNFFDIKPSKIIAYVFWLLLGLYLGYSVALQAIKYMREKR